MSISPSLFNDRLRSVTAAGCAALVLALAIFAASPIAHEWLHVDSDVAGQEHDCAVVLFAGGVSLPLASVEVEAPAAMQLAVSTAKAAEIFLVASRYLRQPERGPPVSLFS